MVFGKGFELMLREAEKNDQDVIVGKFYKTPFLDTDEVSE
jgi:hypothetical protein